MSETNQSVEERRRNMERLRTGIGTVFMIYLLQQVLSLYMVVGGAKFRNPSFLLVCGLLVGLSFQVLGAWVVRGLALLMVDWFEGWKDRG